ncbi:MAG: Fic family protein, partial [Elusimicrobiota bacterium]|nr:Fic family protein [Elusimicrobiota bacterium]
GKIAGSSIKGVFIPVVQKESALIMAYASTTIEGSTLTPQEVKQVSDGERPQKPELHIRMVKNYLDVVRWIREKENTKVITEGSIFTLHKIIGKKAVAGGPVGKYRKVQVYVGDHTPPSPEKVPHLMKKFLDWLNNESHQYHPVLSSALAHLEIATIHPFRDGNGRVARALASWELYRRGFDTLHVFTLDDILLENRKFYYSQLSNARKLGGLADWLEYISDITADGLERAYNRLKSAQVTEKKLPSLSETQKRLLIILAQDGPKTMKQLTAELQITRQGVYKVLNPLLKTKRVIPVGTRRNRQYSITI